MTAIEPARRGGLAAVWPVQPGDDLADQAPDIAFRQVIRPPENRHHRIRHQIVERGLALKPAEAEADPGCGRLGGDGAAMEEIARDGIAVEGITVSGITVRGITVSWITVTVAGWRRDPACRLGGGISGHGL